MRAVSGYLNSYYIQLSGVRILEALRLDYFRKLQVLPLSFLQRKASGDLLSRGMADTQQLQFTLTLLANDGVKQPMTLAGAIGFLVWQAFTTDGVLLVLVCLVIVPLSVLPVRYVGRKVLRRAHQLQAHLGSVTSIFSENLAAAREVRAFGLEEREAGRFAAGTRSLVTAQMKIAKYAQALTPAIEVLSAIGIAATLVFAFGSGVTLETFIAVVTALYMSYEPVKKIGALNNEIKRGTAALDRLEAVLHEPVTITDPAQPAAVGRLRGDIAFAGVTFAYDSAPVLRGRDGRHPRRHGLRAGRPERRGQDHLRQPRAPVLRGRRRRGHHRRAGCAGNAAGGPPAQHRPGLAGPGAVQRHGLQQSAAGLDRRRARRGHGRRDRRPRRRIHPRARPRLRHRGRRARACSSPAARNSGSPSPAPSSATRPSSSSTRPPVRSTPKARRPSRMRSASSWSARRSSSSPIVSAPSAIASLILVFDRGEIVARGNHASLYADNALYKSLYDRQHAGAA